MNDFSQNHCHQCRSELTNSHFGIHTHNTAYAFATSKLISIDCISCVAFQFCRRSTLTASECAWTKLRTMSFLRRILFADVSWFVNGWPCQFRWRKDRQWKIQYESCIPLAFFFDSLLFLKKFSTSHRPRGRLIHLAKLYCVFLFPIRNIAIFCGVYTVKKSFHTIRKKSDFTELKHNAFCSSACSTTVQIVSCSVFCSESI